MMALRRFCLLLSVAAALGAMPSAEAPCALQPSWSSLTIPGRGFTWLKGEALSGPCDVADGEWLRQAGRDQDLFIHLDGPGGSGRYWTITVGVGASNEPAPARGVCFMTTTIGWRTLQQFEGRALPWVGDADGDRQPELVVWTSFVMGQNDAYESALSPWVYELDGQSSLLLNLPLTRALATRVAGAYRMPLRGGSPVSLIPLRRKAADALDAFAGDRCDLAPASKYD